MFRMPIRCTLKVPKSQNKLTAWNFNEISEAIIDTDFEEWENVWYIG